MSPLQLFYADLPAVRIRQIVGDVVLLLWIYLWFRLADGVRDRVLELRGPGARVENAGRGLGDNLNGAADTADRLPIAGDSVADALRRAAGGADLLIEAGRTEQEAVTALGSALFLAVLGFPVLWALWRWARPRWSWMRDARAARILLASGAGFDVLAARAVASSSLTRLARLPAGTLDGWRTGDPGALRTLARLELDGLGVAALAPPAGPVTPVAVRS